jgi:CBS domain-containing protein
MKIKEIMKREVVSVKPEDNVIEVLNLLLKMQISGLPVIDAEGKLKGMLTEKEVLARVLPSYVEKVGRFIYDENPKAVRQKMLSLRTMKVKDIMRREVVTVDEDTALCEVASTMLTQKARRIPILNKAKEVVGIVSRGDVVRALFEERK